MAVTPEAWFKSMPVHTKAYFVAAMGCTLLVTLGALNPVYIYLDFDLVFRKFQLWRLVTCFVFFGKFSLPFIFQMFLLTKSMMNLEAGYYTGNQGAAEMSFLMASGATVMLIFAYFWEGLFFLGPAMVFMVLYVWSRRDPYRQVTIWGFALPAWQYPFALLVLSMLLGANPVLGMLGIGVGHLWHFVNDVVPAVYGYTFLKTPEFLYQLYETGTVAQRHSNWQSSQGYSLR
jgi:Derlin-2/3